MRIISVLCHRSALAWAIVSLTGAASAGNSQDLEFSVEHGALVASLPDGCPLWVVRTGGRSVLDWQTLSDGTLRLSNGVIVSRRGQVVARTHGASHVPLSGRGDPQADCAGWDKLAEVTPPPGSAADSHNSPLFDSQGNAWVVILHSLSGDDELRIRRSNGHDGTWQPLQTLSDSTNYVSQPEGAIDPNGNITIVFRDIQSGYHLYAIRYEPDTGWGPLTEIYWTSDFFQAIEIGADAEGNIAVVFDPLPGGPTVWSQIYDVASDTWAPPTQISPSGWATLLPTVVQNRAGDAVYAIYLAPDIPQPGLYAHRFDSGTKAWGPAQFLPGTATAGFSFLGPYSRFPAAVDASGEVTVLWQSAYPGPYAVYASRTEGGVWQTAHELLAPGPHNTDIENFAGVDSNDQGDAFGVVTRYESGSNRFYAFRYHADDGWQAPDNPYTSTLGLSTRVRICFYRGAHAVATLYGWQDGLEQVTSLIYTGTTWLPDLLDIPENHQAYFQETEADQGEAFLVYEGQLGADIVGILATWLRTAPGDFDCDGDVDADDFAAFASCFTGAGGGPIDPDCNPGDFDGDGDVDCDDFGLFSEEWTGPGELPNLPECSTACEGDANGDGVVDPLDSGFVLSRFGCPVGTGDPACDAADQNADGVVDPLDVGFVLARFGPCD